MEREIKFRFWDGEEMMYSDLYTFEENMIRFLPDDLPSVGITDVMQYTGLKDKNGKEIYEGDVVRCYHFTDRFKKKRYLHHTVKWDEEKALFKFVSSDSKEESLKNGTCMAWVYMKNSKQIEIIGNIHEDKQ